MEEGVGLEDVGAGEGIVEVDRLDRLGLGQGKKVVVPLQMAVAAGEAPAAELFLIEAETLDFGSHSAIEDEHAFGHRSRQRGEDLSPVCDVSKGHSRPNHRARPGRHLRRVGRLALLIAIARRSACAGWIDCLDFAALCRLAMVPQGNRAAVPNPCPHALYK